MTVCVSLFENSDHFEIQVPQHWHLREAVKWTVGANLLVGMLIPTVAHLMPKVQVRLSHHIMACAIIHSVLGNAMQYTMS